MADYHFTIHTGDQYLAGTDSNIFVILHGERGSTEEVRLNGYISGDAFERNQTDTCTIPFAEDVGDIYRITLRSDRQYSGPDWLLNRIEVRAVLDAARGVFRPTSGFMINQWIRDDKAHTFTVTDGYMRDFEIKDQSVTVTGIEHVIAGNPDPRHVLQQRITVRETWNTSLVYEKTTITSVSTKVSVAEKFDAIKTSIESEFKQEIATKTGATAGSELSVEHEYIIRISPGTPERRLVEKWAEKRYRMQFVLGDTSVPDVHVIAERRFMGLAEPTTSRMVMKVADEEMDVELAPPGELLAWSPAA